MPAARQDARMKFLRVIRWMILPLMLLTGCQRSSEDVAKSAKASLQQYLESDRDLKSLHLSVVDLTLVKVGENTYQGLATVSSATSQHEVPLKIWADKQNTMWQADPGAFSAFMLEPKPALDDAAPPPEPSSDDPGISDDSLSSWAIKGIQESYAFRNDAPDDARHGSWTASDLSPASFPSLPGWDYFIVHYSVPERDIDCQWQVGFPASARKENAPSPSLEHVNDCVLQMFSAE